MGSAAPDILHLFATFFQFVVGFACAGHLGFGRDNATFKTLGSTLNTLLLWTVGSLSESEPPSSTRHDLAYFLFFWVYIIVAHLVILNVLLSIIVESWMHVKEESDDYRHVRKCLSGMASANRLQRRRMYSALGGFESASFKMDPERMVHRCAARLGCCDPKINWCIRVKHGCLCLMACCFRQRSYGTTEQTTSTATTPATGSGLSPAKMKALRGFSFARLEVILLQSIQDAKKDSGNLLLYEHNVVLDRMDLSILLWRAGVPKGFAYILFDAFKQPFDDGDVRSGDASFKMRSIQKPNTGFQRSGPSSARRASLPPSLEPILSAANRLDDSYSRASAAHVAASMNSLRDGSRRSRGTEPTERQFQALERRLNGVELKLDAVLEELRSANGHARTRAESMLTQHIP